ncbi:MAG: [FeFe] hydrogenase H-cluster maturation GTPase HydF [Fusobacteria bacterium]|nr:[FeFe] hydrogenase H-cluster maturation GTPase HydF [Fusobacteriota bacterium]
MGNLNRTPISNRLHIAIFGRRNAGKSSLINAITNQELAIVSDKPGTTTDPIYKSMEISKLGPVVIIDTAGIDDIGDLGLLRVGKSKEIIRKTDISLIVFDIENGISKYEEDIILEFKANNIPYILVGNKIDKNSKIDTIQETLKNSKENYIFISAKNNVNIDELKELIIEKSPKEEKETSILGDLIDEGDTVILVTPIDNSAPKGRLILPQVQTIRDIIDNNGIVNICKEENLEKTLNNLKVKPKLVITDSQIFETVSKLVPEDIFLTSFSILFARYKGDLEELTKGAKILKSLKSGDRVLMSEACTHHSQEDDIGRVKIPNWIREKINRDIEFTHCSGRDYPKDIDKYKLVVHCGGCMLNKKEMVTRIKESVEKNTPIVNYGIAIATLHNILDRALKPFEKIYSEWIK